MQKKMTFNNMCDHGLPVKLFVLPEKQMINLFRTDIENK
jgi:hypothetical protein